MKKLSYSFLACAFIFSCNNEPAGEATKTNQEATAAQTKGEPFKVSSESTVSWYGATPTHGQNGTLAISEGNVYIDAGVVTSGKFVIQMNNMNVTSEGLDSAKKADLKGHLLNEDFFDATKFPTAVFEITGLTSLEGDSSNNQTISGNLTIKGIAKNISFPANVEVTENTVKAVAKFVINRKDWGMNYKNDESLGDDWIYDKIELTLNLAANK